MPLWRGGPNTRTLPTVLLTPSASKAADMAHLCVPQNQALGVCRGFAPDIQICGTRGRKNLVNATIISNAEEEEEEKLLKQWLLIINCKSRLLRYAPIIQQPSPQTEFYNADDVTKIQYDVNDFNPAKLSQSKKYKLSVSAGVSYKVICYFPSWCCSPNHYCCFFFD